MTSEQSKIVLNAILQDYDSTIELTAVQELVFYQSCEGKSYKEIAAESGYEHDYIRQVGSQLWQLLSKATGKRVTKQNFHSILKQYQQLQQEAASFQDWGEAVNVSAFWGRQPALTTLKQWIIKDRCSLVAILGIGGVGKTALSVKFAQQVQDEFTYVIWRTIRDVPPIVELLADIIKVLSNQQEIELPDTVAGCLSLLIKHLQQHRCLIVLDNFETILQKGEKFGCYQPGYEGYGELIKRVGEIAHQSCLIITTREKPEEVAALEGEFLPVRVLHLTGIAPTAGKQLLKAKGLTVTESDTQQLVETYSGNPLALKIAATAIKDLFAGDITQFLVQETTIFRGIRQLLEQQFQRLSPLEQQLMYWLAINRESVTASELQVDIFPPTSEASILKALKLLQRRCLIEKNDTGYTQQSVVMEFMTERLIEKVHQEVITADLSLLNTHALIKAQGKYYIRESQIRLILKPLIAKLSSQYRNIQTIADQLSLILCKLREQKITSGYAGGNIINFLCQLPIELTGADFSDLPVWQAYLPNVKLHAVNFAHADLSQSVFLETLGSVLSVAISPDGRLVAAGDTNGEVRVWQVSDGKQLLNLPRGSSWIWSVAFSPDSRILASVDDNVVKLWDSHTGKCLKTLDGHLSWLYDVAFSCDRKTVATASCDHTVKLWDIDTGKCLHTLTGHQDVVYSVAFSPLPLNPPASPPTAPPLTKGGQGGVVASGSNDQTIRIWDVNTGECLKTLEGNPGWIWREAFSPSPIPGKGGQGGILASGSHDYTIRIWDISTGECLQTLQGHRNWVLSVAFSSNGRTLASSSEDGTVRLWNLATGKCLRVFQGHRSRVCSVAFTPNIQTLASGSLDSTVQLWDVRTGQCRKILRGYTNLVWSVAFSPQGHILASGGADLQVKLWDLSTGDCYQTFQAHDNRVQSVAFHPDGKILASASHDGMIKLWNIEPREFWKTLQVPRPYEGMKITQVKGLTPAQKATLKALGAVEEVGLYC